jgi:hypothetical protein
MKWPSPRFDVAPSLSPRRPSLYTSVTSIDRIPFTIPYVRIAQNEAENWICYLPKCGEKDPITGRTALTCKDDKGNVDNNPKYARDICSCGGYQMGMEGADQADSNYGQLLNANKEVVRIEEWPKSTYEAFLRAFLVDHTTSNRTNMRCESTYDCLKGKPAGNSPNSGNTNYECVGNVHHDESDTITPGVCVLPSAYHHLALSPAVEPQRDGNFYTTNPDLCTDAATKWICNAYKQNGGNWEKVKTGTPGATPIDMMWTEPNWLADIGVTLYPDGGNYIAWISLVFGLFVMVASIVGSQKIHSLLQKQKLL